LFLTPSSLLPPKALKNVNFFVLPDTRNRRITGTNILAGGHSDMSKWGNLIPTRSSHPFVLIRSPVLSIREPNKKPKHLSALVIFQINCVQEDCYIYGYPVWV
jgi:hypothetical protein